MNIATMAAACAVAALCAGAAAQPAAVDLGALDPGTVQSGAATIAPGGVTWFRFTLPAPINAASLSWLDLDCVESLLSGDDTVMALFDSSGHLLVVDDNDGSGDLSAMSFGLGSGELAGAAGMQSDGRDGVALAAGVYFVAVTAPPANFGDGWNVITAHARSGRIEVRAEAGSWSAGAQEWSEVAGGGGHAGSMLADAQVVAGTGPLSTIHGVLRGAADADVYKIRVCSPATFVATMVSGVPGLGSRFDSQLWLFDGDGHGVTFNDNTTVASGQATITGQFLTQAGEYYLAVTGTDRDAVDSLGRALWNDAPVELERRADGPGGGSALAGWTGDGVFGAYRVVLEGACFIEVATHCPSDLDDGSGTGTPDGGVTIDDLIYFVGAFEIGLVQADLDDGSGTGTPDGGVTIEDLLYFIEHFELGC